VMVCLQRLLRKSGGFVKLLGHFFGEPATKFVGRLSPFAPCSFETIYASTSDEHA